MAQPRPRNPAPRRIGLGARTLRALLDVLRRSAEAQELQGLEASKRLGRETGARC